MEYTIRRYWLKSRRSIRTVYHLAYLAENSDGWQLLGTGCGCTVGHQSAGYSYHWNGLASAKYTVCPKCLDVAEAAGIDLDWQAREVTVSTMLDELSKSAVTKPVFMSDPGHGWLRVDAKELFNSDLLDSISAYSYWFGPHVYLEEDCDAGLWLENKRRDSEVVYTSKNLKRMFIGRAKYPSAALLKQLRQQES